MDNTLHFVMSHALFFPTHCVDVVTGKQEHSSIKKSGANENCVELTWANYGVIFIGTYCQYFQHMRPTKFSDTAFCVIDLSNG